MPKRKAKLPLGEFAEIIHEHVLRLGGYVNSHSHLDRAGTLDPKYLGHFGITPLQATSSPLKVKQSLTGELHKGPAYGTRDLEKRMSHYLHLMADFGTRKVVSFVDVTPDVGLEAMETAVNLKEKLRDEIEFQTAAHPIFGFKEDPHHSESRWQVFEEACKTADIIGALPERDDRIDSIGFDEHIKRVLILGKKLRKEVHIHVDQDNDPRQNHTLNLIEAVRWIGSPERETKEGIIDDRAGEPTVWAIHAISPSAYNEEKFRLVLEGLKKYNIGVICCPRAAVSMRHLRSINSPIHPSIARILEMVCFGISLRFGTDNIADMYIPTSSGTMLEEILILADVIRFYEPKALAKFASNTILNQTDIEAIRGHLEKERKALTDAEPNFKHCIDIE